MVPAAPYACEKGVADVMVPPVLAATVIVPVFTAKVAVTVAVPPVAGIEVVAVIVVDALATFAMLT